MPKRVIDFDAMWGSDKLASCAEWAQGEYAWLYGLADASGCFELTNMRVIWGRVAAIRKNLTIERLAEVFEEFQEKGLLFVWEQEGKRYGHWTGSDVPGRLPPPSWRMRLEKLAPGVPKARLAEYMSRFSRGRAGMRALKGGVEEGQGQDWGLDLGLNSDLEGNRERGGGGKWRAGRGEADPNQIFKSENQFTGNSNSASDSKSRSNSKESSNSNSGINSKENPYSDLNSKENSNAGGNSQEHSNAKALISSNSTANQNSGGQERTIRSEYDLIGNSESKETTLAEGKELTRSVLAALRGSNSMSSLNSPGDKNLFSSNIGCGTGPESQTEGNATRGSDAGAEADRRGMANSGARANPGASAEAPANANRGENTGARGDLNGAGARCAACGAGQGSRTSHSWAGYGRSNSYARSKEEIVERELRVGGLAYTGPIRVKPEALERARRWEEERRKAARKE